MHLLQAIKFKGAYMLNNKSTSTSSDYIGIKRFVCALFLGLFLTACSDNGVQVFTQFANTQDIKEGGLVYLDDSVVGEVVDVKNNEQGSRVVIEFDKKAAATISDKSAVVVNRLKEGAPLEVYNRTSSSESYLQDGQEIQALDSMFQVGAWMLGDAIQLGAGSVSDYVQSFQDYLQGDKFQQDKAQVTEQLNAAKQAAQVAVQQAEKEVASAMQGMIDSEQEMAAAVEQLGEELSPMLEELGSSGAQLITELEKFTEGLQKTDQGEQQAGKELMQSLLRTLEKLNQSIEQGVQGDVSTDKKSG